MTHPRGGTTLQMGPSGDQCYVHQHNQTGVKSGQYLPPVKRNFIYSNFEQMRFTERIEDEQKCKGLWDWKMGKYLYVKGGPEGHFSEFGQRRFNLSGQIAQPFIGSPQRKFFESQRVRSPDDGGFRYEDSKACYERQTGLHFRNPMSMEGAGRLQATDNSGYSTPTFSVREAAARKARSESPGMRCKAFYVDTEKFRESWPWADSITNGGQQVWWRRHYTDRLTNTDFPSWPHPRAGREDGFLTRGSCTCGQNGGMPGF